VRRVAPHRPGRPSLASHRRWYAPCVADDGRSMKPAIGIAGAIAAIVSIWWFALRPRRHRDDAPPE